MELSAQSLLPLSSHRSYDSAPFAEAFADHPEDLAGHTPEQWLGDRKNAMYVKDGNVGLLTYTYPGLYTAHWFFKVRGREAINLARELLDEAFHELPMKAIRGITPKSLPAARWAARQVGMKSQGFVETPFHGECEILSMTKDEFYEKEQ